MKLIRCDGIGNGRSQANRGLSSGNNNNKKKFEEISMIKQLEIGVDEM